MQQTPLSKQKNRTPLCGHLSLLICGTSFFSCTNEICQEISEESIGYKERCQVSGVRGQQGLRLKEREQRSLEVGGKKE
jgi:hypothetical protein